VSFLASPKLSKFILKFDSCFDNSGEFKKEVTAFCKARNINIIRGRARHPQSQGSIEQANKFFKAKLRAVQIETGTKWVFLLPRIAKIMNSSSNIALPKETTPNKVWFNRSESKWPEISERRKKVTKRYKSRTFGGHNNPIQCSSSSNKVSSKEEKEEVSESDDKKLSEFHQAVKKSQDLYNQQIIKKKKGVLIKYRKGQIVLLKIPKQNKRNTKALRLPCHVLEIKNKVRKTT
jgi:hypothetical protein